MDLQKLQSPISMRHRRAARVLSHHYQFQSSCGTMVPHQNRRVQLAAILAAVTLLTGDCFLLRWRYLRYFLVPGSIHVQRLNLPSVEVS